MGIAQADTAEHVTVRTGHSPGAHGAVVAIGGAEDKFKDKVILSRFVELAGVRS